MNILNPKINEYIEGAIPARKPPFDEMEAYAKEHGFPIIGPLVGTLLKQIAYSIKAKRIFELGSGYGYSALWMAQALPEDGKVYLTDRKEENKQMAIRHFERAGLLDKMEFFVGDALEAFKKHEGPFDIILNDIDKTGYPNTIPHVKERLRSGGYFITDNVLWSGRIFDEQLEDSTKAILKFTRDLYDDKDFMTSIIPLRDGISVAVKL
jgi:predicted O-methyltransferase YrrM